MSTQHTLLITLCLGLAACGGNDPSAPAATQVQLDTGAGDAAPVVAPDAYLGVDGRITNPLITNATAYIPPQCYTRTQDAAGASHNPCFACHTNGKAPNYLDDRALQLSYSLPGPALVNPWSNLFSDRSAEVAAIDDATLLAYVRGDNYHTADGGITLAERLNALPKEWDLDRDAHWDGYTPDAYFAFDAEGFDLDRNGQPTGWRAFAYAPFPGTFWPTNGSSDDVLIRLAPALQHADDGQFDRLTYQVNLAIVEALILRRDVPIPAVAEATWQVDLNKNGVLDRADHIAYDWEPSQGREMSYVGEARRLQQAGTLHLAAGLFPEGTEFLHSVRYLDPDAPGALAPRMKELRYAKKGSWYNYSELKQVAIREARERALNADQTRQVPGDMERGLFTQGWHYQGFIEDTDGRLRPQTKEEGLYCMGCHSGIGATTDTTFAFARKFTGQEAHRGGWYHWTQKGLEGSAEPRREDGQYEYSLYLQHNGAGDEFRGNQEVMERFFDAKGALRQDALDALHRDVSRLLVPSRARALTLDKAYWRIVQAQSFTQGRDATIRPQANVWRELEQNRLTGVTLPVSRVEVE